VKKRDNPKRGKRGRKHGPSAVQRGAQEALKAASDGWNERTEEERRAWDTAGKQHRNRSRGGKSRRLSGRDYYVMVNTARARIGLAPLALPPGPQKHTPPAIGAFTITSGSGGLALKLGVPNAPGEHTAVWASPPRNAGRRFNRDFRYLGPQPAPVGGESDLTELYVEKFGEPPRGKRVFIQIRQHVDGWKDIPAQRDALVPAKPGPAGNRKRSARPGRQPKA
jgi:hypothetical protein